MEETKTCLHIKTNDHVQTINTRTRLLVLPYESSLAINVLKLIFFKTLLLAWLYWFKCILIEIIVVQFTILKFLVFCNFLKSVFRNDILR